MMRRLVKRAQFVRASRGFRASQNGMQLQAVSVEAEEPGIGFTVTKKAGTAVERNRIKRRLRAAAKTCNNAFQSRHEYVLIGRREALHEPFLALVSALDRLIAKIHSQRQSQKRT